MAMGPETPQEVQVYLLEPTESEMASFLHANIGNGQKTAEIDVLAMGDQEIKEEMKDQEIKEEVKDQEIKEEKKDPEYDNAESDVLAMVDQEIKEEENDPKGDNAESDVLAGGDQEKKEENDPKYDVNRFNPHILREILQNETSSRSQYRVLPITPIVQPEPIVGEEITPRVQALYNDDEIAVCSDRDKLPLIDKADSNQQMKEESPNSRDSDAPTACSKQSVITSAEFGVTREGKNVGDSAEFNQQMNEQRLDPESSDKSTARFEESALISAECGQNLTTKTTLVKHIEVHASKFGVAREGNEYQPNHDVTDKNRSADELFSCAHCSEKFKSESDLIIHVQKHQNVVDCSKGILLEKNSKTGRLRLLFPNPNDEISKRQLENKVTEYYTDKYELIEPRFFCAHCNGRFRYKTDLLLHVGKHMKQFYLAGNVHCPICGRKFPYRKCLRDHVAIHFKETFYQCKQCSVTAIKKYSLLQHTLYFHCEGSSFQCVACEKTFPSYLTFRRHKQSHSNKENPSSEFTSAINKRFGDITSLQGKTQLGQEVSSKVSKTFVCSLCRPKALFRTKDDLDSHIELKHELKCKTCSKVYRTPHELARHCLRKKCSTRYFSCDYCGSKFVSKKLVKKHIMGHSVFKNRMKEIKCKLCGVLILNTRLYSHNLTCHKRKTYVCEQCGAVFARNDYLTKHMFKHTKERPHLCSYCAATFSRKDNLKSHERKHAMLGDRMIPKPPIWKRPLK